MKLIDTPGHVVLVPPVQPNTNIGNLVRIQQSPAVPTPAGAFLPTSFSQVGMGWYTAKFPCRANQVAH